MRLRDPLMITLLLVTFYTAGLGVALALLFERTPEAVAAEVNGIEAARRQPPSREPIEVVVEQGMPAEAIGQMLAERGVIADAGRFSALLAFTGLGPSLQAGRYELPANTPAAEVIRRMRLGLTAEILVAIPEGLRVEEVGEILASQGLVTLEEWEEALQRPWPHPFLQSLPEGAGLIGYLMPASYPAHRSDSAEDLVQAMLDHFAERVTPDIIAEAEDQAMTLHEVVTLASIVEKEAAIAEDQPLVASVLLNRLAEGMPLEMDPTVQFAVATPESVERFGWWKQELTVDDLAVDSPYNTRLYPGLPPGPIANPGLDAILAVIRAPETGYLYFAAAPECDGSHRFAETFEEHLANVEALQQSACGESSRP